MSERNHFEDENRALALSALTLVKTLMNALERKGVLDGGEIDAVVEESLVALEYRHQDAATGLARRIVEAIAVMRSGHLPGQPPKGLVQRERLPAKERQLRCGKRAGVVAGRRIP